MLLVRAWGLALWALRLGSLADTGDAFQFLLVDDADAAAFQADNSFAGEVAERADGVAGGHVGQACKVFAREVYVNGFAVALKAVGVLQEEQAFGQAAAAMLLRQSDNAAIGNA